jgi:hypothetical protein
LGEEWRVTRVSPPQDDFNTAEHLTGTPGVHDFIARHLHFDAKVAFNPGYGIYGDFLAHYISSLS